MTIITVPFNSKNTYYKYYNNGPTKLNSCNHRTSFCDCYNKHIMLQYLYSKPLYRLFTYLSKSYNLSNNVISNKNYKIQNSTFQYTLQKYNNNLIIRNIHHEDFVNNEFNFQVFY